MMRPGFFLRLKPILVSVFLLSFLLNSAAPLLASDDALYPGFPSMRESHAYEAFKKRPADDHSKLVYLIDRFQEADIQILYDGFYFKSGFAAQVSRWFLKRYYKEEAPKQWIMRWCNQSIARNELIWVRLPDGSFKLSREVLLDEIKRLDRAIAEDGIARDSR